MRALRAAAAAAAAVACAVALGACSADIVPGIGGDDSDTRDGKRAKAVVERFAQASGPEACEMFTPAGLRKVYGKDEKPSPPPEIDQPLPPVSLAECRRRSARFSGEKVDIEKVNLTESGAARVEATTGEGARTFAVTLRRNARGDWLIDDIRER